MGFQMVTKKFLLLALMVSLQVIGMGAFQQEMFWHESKKEDGNYFAFRNNVPNASKYPMENVKKLCVRGSGAMYSTLNYGTFSTRFNSGGPELFCVAWNFTKIPVTGFRFGGSLNASVDALSLYHGPLFQGEEILITDSTHEGISTTVGSLMSTGKSSWELFEGTQLNGKSACWTTSMKKGRLINFHDDVRTLGISTVGSVRKGCPS